MALSIFDAQGQDVTQLYGYSFDHGTHVGSVEPPAGSTVPEPTTLTLLATGLAGVVGTRRRRTHVLPSDAHGRDHRA
ncbi:MAG TPA: PEP-CTERM sorting domain-containing protein [Gemmatimonadales bacterium]|nr:PEP-CTERM sorting domain-containing protein [Gemmatimonadales bacterium]